MSLHALSEVQSRAAQRQCPDDMLVNGSLLNSPRFTDRTSGISNNRFIVGPGAPVVEIDHQIQQKISERGDG